MKAVAFERPAHCGASVHIQEIVKKKNLILYFFPPLEFDKIEAVGQEAYLFKNYMVRLNLKKIEVLGVTDHPEDLTKTFVQRFGIPFHFIYDRDHEIAKSYGAYKEATQTLERRLVCIRKGGTIRKVYQGKEIEQNLKRMVSFTRLPWYRKLFRFWLLGTQYLIF